MDPQATLINCERDINAGAFRSALACLIDYYDWRVRGGFQPVFGSMGGDNKARALATRIQDGLEQAY
jgi:hypothetical protein